MSTARVLREAAGFVRRTPLHPQWLLPSRREIEKVIAGEARGTVLDVGCADQWVKRYIAKDARYIGLDYPPTGSLLYRARPHVLGDAARLPVQSARIDAVLLLEVLEHVRDPVGVIGEIARVLRPGGVLVLTVPFLYPIHDAPHDYQRFTEHGLRNLLDREFELIALRATSGAVQNAGLNLALAIAGTAIAAFDARRPSALIAAALCAAIPAINVVCKIAAFIFPWRAATGGYEVVARRR